MKVIFSGSGYFSVNDLAGIALSLRTYKDAADPEKTIGACSFGYGDEQRSFKFSPGAYDYAGWLDAVCQMAIDAKQIHVCDVDGDALYIETVGVDGRRVAQLEKSGKCGFDGDFYDGMEK